MVWALYMLVTSISSRGYSSTSTVNDEQVMHVHNGRVAIILYILQVRTQPEIIIE